MHNVERQVAREIRAMTRKEIIVTAMDGQLTWIQAADILGLSARHPPGQAAVGARGLQRAPRPARGAGAPPPDSGQGDRTAVPVAAAALTPECPIRDRL